VTNYVWTSADGAVVNLSDWASGMYVLADGTGGLDSPSYEFVSHPFAGADGEDVDAVVAQSAHPVLGMYMLADTPVVLADRLRALVHALRPQRGPGVLSVARDDGTVRRLRCYYEQGLEGARVPGSHYYKAAIGLYAPSPWWRGDPVPLGFGLAAPSVFLSTRRRSPCGRSPGPGRR
jgi:hypothetical protein